MSITIGIGKNLKITPTPTPTANEPEIDTYISGLATELSVAQITRLNNFVYCLKNGLGISNLSEFFDNFYLFAGETQESSLRNLISRNYDCTLVNAPAWTQYEGFKGDGATNYINTNFSPSTQGVRYTQNSASFGFYNRFATGAVTQFAMGIATGSTDLTMLPYPASGSFNVRINTNTSSGAAAPNSLGFFIANKYNAATENDGYRNSVLIIDGIQTNDGIPPGNSFILAINNGAGGTSGFSNYQVSCVFHGKGLSPSEVTIITNCVEAYMDANGKGVIT